MGTLMPDLKPWINQILGIFPANTEGGEKNPTKHECQCDRTCAEICLKPQKKKGLCSCPLQSTVLILCGILQHPRCPRVCTSTLCLLCTKTSEQAGLETSPERCFHRRAGPERFSQGKSLSCALPGIHHMLRGQTNYPAIPRERIKAGAFCLIAFASRSQGGQICDKSTEHTVTAHSLDAGISTAQPS